MTIWFYLVKVTVISVFAGLTYFLLDYALWPEGDMVNRFLAAFAGIYTAVCSVGITVFTGIMLYQQYTKK